MDRGYVKLWRKSMNSQVWQSPELWQLWCYCLMRANHKEAWVTVRTGKGFTQVQVKRGQFIFGRNQVAKELGQKPRSIYDRMLKLEKCQNLTIQPNKHYSIVTICNYDLYQPKNGDDTTTNPTPNQQPTNTDNNIKNVKKKDMSTSEKKSPREGDSIPFASIISYLNEKTGRNFKPTTELYQKPIKKRWDEGKRESDFRLVVDTMTVKWLDNPTMVDCLTPTTLFGEKMAKYLDMADKPKSHEDLEAEENMRKLLARRKQNEEHD